MKKQIMKLTYHSLAVTSASLIVVVALIINLSGCSKGSEISKQEEVTAALTSGQWKIKTVIVDGVDKTGVYKDLSLTFTATGFTTTNGGVVWPASGTYTFTDANATVLKRNDGLEIQIQEATTTSLRLGLTWAKTTLGAGRIESVGGQNVFSFGK